MQFAMFPTDKGASVSQWVSKIIEMVRESNYPYKLSPMGTIVETETIEQANQIVAQAYKLLQPDCKRVYCTVTFDIKEGKTGRMAQKIKSIENRIGEVNV